MTAGPTPVAAARIVFSISSPGEMPSSACSTCGFSSRTT
jgi:hypothetical protein